MTKDIQQAREEQLSHSQREQLDSLCDAFETAWQEHACPQMQDYLDGCEPPLLESLLEELLRIELHWHRHSTDQSRLRDRYLKRYSEYRSIVERVLGSEPREIGAHTGPSDELGPFHNLDKIGDGGFGIVFRAWDSRHQRNVALKIPRFVHQLAGRELDEFFREARSAGSLDHPNIARVWDSGTAAGVTYIAYQLVEGENLKTQLEEISQRTPLQIAEFVMLLAQAVHYAHQQGIIHRDIKPSNVLLTPDDQPVLTDFGLALAVGGDATRSLAARIGTLDYMSPEQATGAQDKVDERTDLWSLGVLLYELLTGQLPFAGATDLQLCESICNASQKRVRLLRSDVPRDLEVVIDRCLQKRPDDRLDSCGELADELERIVAGRPILSRRVSFVERGWRWCQRNPWPLAAFAIILVATVFGTWSWGLRLSEGRQNENTVQNLQMQLEIKNVERRALLADLMRSDPPKIELLEQDVAFFENQVFSDLGPREKLFCIETLLLNDRLAVDRFRSDDSQRMAIMSLLRRLIEDNNDPESVTKAKSAVLALEAAGGM